jgi:hypothetical protein
MLRTPLGVRTVRTLRTVRSSGITYYLYISQKQHYERKVDSSVNESNFSHMEDIAKLVNSRVISIEKGLQGLKRYML